MLACKRQIWNTASAFSKADSCSYLCHSRDGCMDILAQIRGNGRKNTFSQPLILIECIRCVLKGLEMFSSEQVCRGYPKKERAHVLSWWDLRTFPKAPPSNVSMGNLTQWQVALWWSLEFYTPILWRIDLHKLCIHTHTYIHTYTPTPQSLST